MATFSSPTVTAATPTPASSSSTRPANSSRPGARRAARPARSTARTRWRWTRAAGCFLVAVLIENLDAVVAAVAKKQPAARVHRQRVRAGDLAGRAALLAPGLGEFAGLGQLDDAGRGV